MASPNLTEIVTTTLRSKSMSGFKKSPTEAQEWGSRAMPEHEANETRVMGPHEEEKPSVIGDRTPHSFPKAKAGAHGYNHGVNKRDGHMRLSGHTGAHRIGKK